MKRAGQSLKRQRRASDVFVELSTPQGKVFSGKVAAAEFSPANALVQLEPGRVSYFGLISSAELVLRIGARFLFFALFRANARILGQRLTILAEVIEPVTTPLRNCGNAMCDCGEVEGREPRNTRTKSGKSGRDKAL